MTIVEGVLIFLFIYFVAVGDGGDQMGIRQ